MKFEIRTAVMPLIGLNVFFFILQIVLGNNFTEFFMLISSDIFTRPWILLTSMFLHGGLNHLFFNRLCFYRSIPIVFGFLRLLMKSFIFRIIFYHGLKFTKLCIVLSLLKNFAHKIWEIIKSWNNSWIVHARWTQNSNTTALSMTCSITWYS